MCRQKPYVRLKTKKKILVHESAIFQNKPICTFGQNAATLDCLVGSSYPQLHGIVNLIQILQGGCGDCALTMADIPTDNFALTGTLVDKFNRLVE